MATEAEIEEPALVLGKALAAWGNPPRWDAPRADCSRGEAELRFASFLELVCANHGLTIVRLGILETAEQER